MNAAAATQSASSGDDTAWVRSGARRNWGRLQPPGADFSVEIPQGGEEVTRPAPMGDQMVEVKGYRVRDGWAVYALIWFKGPTLGETDDRAFKPLLKEFMEGAAESYKIDNRREDFNCRPPTGKHISQNGYTGVEFDLTSCRVPWRVRMYTKVVDGEREMYIAAAAYAEEDAANVSRFLRSFTVGSVTTRAR
jgi:hypothetical protein